MILSPIIILLQWRKQQCKTREFPTENRCYYFLLVLFIQFLSRVNRNYFRCSFFKLQVIFKIMKRPLTTIQNTAVKNRGINDLKLIKFTLK